METLPFLSLCEDKNNPFSDAYLNLILEIGSAVDVALKNYCSMLKLDFTGDNIKDYYVFIGDARKGFADKSIKLTNSVYDFTISTWQEWKNKNAPE